jgi:Putative addiction module component
MTHREQVLQEALSLPPEDRAYVAAALEESLSPADPSQAASGAELLAELKRRSSAYRAGAASAKPAADVLAEQRRRQAGEAKA